MSREAGVPLEKVTLNLVQGDKEILQTYFSATGWTVQARNIINNYCNALRERDSQEIQSTLTELNIELPEMEIKQ